MKPKLPKLSFSSEFDQDRFPLEKEVTSDSGVRGTFAGSEDSSKHAINFQSK